MPTNRAPLCRPGRDNNCDVLRLALATAVMFSHSYGFTRSEPWEPVYWLTRRRASVGGLAVDGFFLLSGFLVAQSWARSPSVAGFLRRRAMRVFPGFVAASVACAFAFGPMGAADPAAYRAAFDPVAWAASVATLRQPAIPPTFEAGPFPSFVNGSLWTIPHEFACYLCLAAMGAVGLARGPRRWVFAGMLALGVVDLALAPILDPRPKMPDYLGYGVAGDWLRFRTFFVCGVCCWLFADRVPRSGRAALCCLALLAAGVWFGPLWRAALVPCAAYLLFYLAFGPPIPGEAFARRADLSYGLYLYAWPCQQVVAMRWPGLGVAAFFAASLALTLPCAAASWFLVERPSLRTTRRPAHAGSAPAPPLYQAAASPDVGT